VLINQFNTITKLKGVYNVRGLLKNPLILIFIGILAWHSFSGIQSVGDWFYSMILTLPGIIIGLSLHEFAHAKVANMLGDDVPKLQGRVSLNPAAHIDILGLFAIIFIGFGWGKPVEINPLNFKHKRRDSFLVSIAGVTMNFIVAVIFAFIIFLIVKFSGNDLLGTGFGESLIRVLQYTIWINLVLMVFNLLPVPPLDGFGIVTEIFNLEKYSWYQTVYSNGFVILMILLIFDVVSKILTPAVTSIYGFIMNLFF